MTKASLIPFLIQATQALRSGTATTTRYWDCSGGACGCSFGSSDNPIYCHSNALFAAPAGNQYGAKFYGSASISTNLGGDWWLGSGCGKCWKLTGSSNAGGGGQSTIIVKGANFCPESESWCNNGKDHFIISAPGFNTWNSDACNNDSDGALQHP